MPVIRRSGPISRTSRASRAAPSSYRIANLRLTIQATPRNKFGVFWDEQKPCGGAPWSAELDGCRNQPTSGFIYGGAATFSPEAGGTGAGGTSGGYVDGFQRVQQVTWSSPVSNRFLLEAGFGTYLARYGSGELPGNPTRDMVRVVEQCAAGCAGQRQHPEPGVSLAELGGQLERRAHLARVGVVRDRRAQHEVRLSGRVSLVQPEDVHQRLSSCSTASTTACRISSRRR